MMRIVYLFIFVSKFLISYLYFEILSGLFWIVICNDGFCFLVDF